MPSQTYLALIQSWLSLQINHCCIVIRKQELLSDCRERSRSHSQCWGWALGLNVTGSSSRGLEATACRGEISHSQHLVFIPQSRMIGDKLRASGVWTVWIPLELASPLEFGSVLIYYRVLRITLPQPQAGSAKSEVFDELRRSSANSFTQLHSCPPSRPGSAARLSRGMGRRPVPLPPLMLGKPKHRAWAFALWSWCSAFLGRITP